MDDTLKILIAYYEEERKQLLQLIDEYTKEWEYQLAHFHAQALFQVNGKLQILYSLQDRGYSDKHWREEHVKRLENELNSENAEYMKEYLSKELQREREVLEKLNERRDPVNDPPNGGAFDEALSSLLQGAIRGFTLFLSREDKFHFDFTYKSKTLRVVLPSVKRHIRTKMFSEEDTLVLQDMGFEYNNRNSRLILYLKGTKEDIAYELKWRLAKIVFEILDFPTLAGKSCIAIKDKANR